MATYKVIQDIESEDKLLGPFTLRQFIYAVVVIVTGFIAFQLAKVQLFLVFPLIPMMMFFGLLAAPFGHDQSSEVWLLAKIRFFLKPRLRIWDQSGMQELVTITVPKQMEKHLTDGLSQTEVKSRLQALANTIDSRGWAVKNVNVNLFSEPSYLGDSAPSSDRLVDTAALPQEVPAYDIFAADDILDEASNPTAQHLEAMISQSEQAHRQAVVATVKQPAPVQAGPPADYWFMNQPTQPPKVPAGLTTFNNQPAVTPGAQVDNLAPVAAADTGQAEQALLEQIHQDKAGTQAGREHMKTLQPIGDKAPPAPAPAPTNKAVIAGLATNNDRSLESLSREANKVTDLPPDDEVVISLR